MDKKSSGQLIKDLTLLLLYLTAWQEKVGGVEFTRSWKGYDFDVLNKLDEEDMTQGSFKAKSVILTEKGIKKAKKLASKYV